MPPMTKCFDVTVRDKVAHLRMIRPERANSMIPEFWRELPEIVRRLSDEGACRVILLSAEGRHFCSGMDTTVFTGSGGVAEGQGAVLGPRRAAQLRESALRMQEALSTLEQARMPVLAAIQGACVGGGLDLATACDVRYATADAFFCVQEVNIGITADVGTLQRLPKLIPEGVAREYAYTGRRMPSWRAKEVGLVNEVWPTHDEMLAAVGEVAAEVASKSPLAILGTKVTMNYTRDHSVADSLDYIATWQAGMLDGADMAEAFRAKLAGEPPTFADLPPAGRSL